MTEARIICDSISPRNERLTTFIVTGPRFILAEINTHRDFSRNAASSRAIPVKRMLAAVMENPAMPVWWGLNEPGMVANAELDDTVKRHRYATDEYGNNRDHESTDREHAKRLWLAARDSAVGWVQEMLNVGLHKQVANRCLEPWAHVTDLITATDWDNFYALRAHPAAQPEFRELAFKMLDCHNASRPAPRHVGEYHIPFGDQMPDGLTQEQRIKVAVARAARLSYLTFEGEIDVAKDYALHDQLLTAGHMSPFEHVASVAATAGRVGNLDGWIQYRKTLAGERKTEPRLRKWTFDEASQAVN